MGKVGLLFCANGEILTDLIDVDHAELYGDFKIGKSSHYEIWKQKYYKIYNNPYDFFPRGRVVFKSYIISKKYEFEIVSKLRNIKFSPGNYN